MRANLKRKFSQSTSTNKDAESGDGTSTSIDVDADGDEEMKDDENAASSKKSAASSKNASWQSLKQPRFEGDLSVKSTASFASSDEPSNSSDAARSDSTTDPSSTTPSSSSATKKSAYVRPTSKPLPKIQRHAPAQLDASAFEPVNPEMSDISKSVFGGDVVPAEPPVKQEDEVKPESDLPPLPTTGFGALGLSPRLLRCLVEKLHLKYPTRIQKEGIPLLLDGQRDALIKSETGTGKTLTYLIPIVERLSTEATRIDRTQGTRAIIMSPTRELCLQIHGVLQNLLDKAGFYWLISGIIMGGEKKKSEKMRLRKGLHILICTPGRLLDHLENTESLVLNRLSYFVLDEADRLMDMGFERDLRKIIDLLNEKAIFKPAASVIRDPRTGLEIKSAKTLAKEAEEKRQRKRQNLLVSATLTQEIETMANITLTDPILIGFKILTKEEQEELNGTIKNEEGEPALVNSNKHLEDTSMPEGLIQLYLQVEHRHKLVGLAALLRKKVIEAEMNNKHFKCVVFFSTCASVEFHHSLFKYSYWPYERNAHASLDVPKNALFDTSLLKLHGNLTQQERTRTYQEFCKNAEGILLCTDVAARGLDLPAVDYILQYDPPEDTADYIHRVGRTARMGRKGQAVLFLMSSELDYLNILKDKAVSTK